jgi:uridylate kinase
VGGGNIIRGRDTGTQDRNRMDHMGMLATAINALALEDALCRLGVPARVLSAVAMERFCDSYSARAATRLLEEGYVVLFACGTGCPFFSTDTAAALRAAEIGADALLLAKNVDAVYSADPRRDPHAVRYTHLSYDRVIAENLQATDQTAITLCREQNIPIRVFALCELAAVLEGDGRGTRIDGTPQS